MSQRRIEYWEWEDHRHPFHPSPPLLLKWNKFMIFNVHASLFSLTNDILMRATCRLVVTRKCASIHHQLFLSEWSDNTTRNVPFLRHNFSSVSDKAPVFPRIIVPYLIGNDWIAPVNASHFERREYDYSGEFDTIWDSRGSSTDLSHYFSFLIIYLGETRDLPRMELCLCTYPGRVRACPWSVIYLLISIPQ